MAKHTITVNLPDTSLRNTLEDIITERVADEFGVNDIDILDVRGQKKAIKEEAKKLYPRFLKAILKSLSEEAVDNAIDVVDNLVGFHGPWTPLDDLVDKITRDPGLSEDLDELLRKQRLRKLSENAETLGYKLVEIDE